MAVVCGRVRLKENGLLDEDMPTLLELTFNCVAANPGVLAVLDNKTKKLRLRDDVRLPHEICDR